MHCKPTNNSKSPLSKLQPHPHKKPFSMTIWTTIDKKTSKEAYITKNSRSKEQCPWIFEGPEEKKPKPKQLWAIPSQELSSLRKKDTEMKWKNKEFGLCSNKQNLKVSVSSQFCSSKAHQRIQSWYCCQVLTDFTSCGVRWPIPSFTKALSSWWITVVWVFNRCLNKKEGR